jgi:hypothetical protein
MYIKLRPLGAKLIGGIRILMDICIKYDIFSGVS